MELQASRLKKAPLLLLHSFTGNKEILYERILKFNKT